ncbi:cysteine hydrolase family protein [Alloalcanivorax gelatiniphagus]
MTSIPEGSALVVVDAQQGFEHPSWGARNNPACDDNIAALVAAFVTAGMRIVYVRHDSQNAAGQLHPSGPGNAFKPYLDAHAPDLLVSKQVNSAFHGSPDLDGWLRAQDVSCIVVAGITTNHCCETTARVGGNLGYDVRFVLDATHTFDRTGPDGTTMTADELARATATNLHGEFATVVTTDAVCAALERRTP